MLLVYSVNIHIVYCKPLSDKYMSDHFSPFVIGYSFTLLTNSFVVRKLFNLIQSRLSVPALASRASGGLVKNKSKKCLCVQVYFHAFLEEFQRFGSRLAVFNCDSFELIPLL